MIDYYEAGDILAGLIDELPDGIFEKLNGGVQLIEEPKTEEDGTITLGMYFVDALGRRVELYYGSFIELYGEMEYDELRERLKKTLHHELTHHVESMAGDRSLERWDERQAELCGFNGIEVHSILFVDDDCPALAPAATVFFNGAKTGYAAEVTVSCAAAGEVASTLNPKAVKACAALDEDISHITPIAVTRELVEEFDVLLCMTMGQAELLSSRFQNMDEKIMCLAGEDIEPPVFSTGWKRCMVRLLDATVTVIDELNLED